MFEPATHVLRLVFTRLVQQNLFTSVGTWRVLFFLRIHHRLASSFKGSPGLVNVSKKIKGVLDNIQFFFYLAEFIYYA